MSYYLKGGSNYNTGNKANVWVAVHLSGYTSDHYTDLSWKNLNTSGARGDPYWRLGGNGGQNLAEIGLSGSYRLKADQNGIYGYNPENGSWTGLMSGVDVIDDSVFGTGWDGQNSKAPTQDRVYDAMNKLLYYVDRGDPAASDWDQSDLTLDAAWHDLNCSGIVTDPEAVLIHFRVSCRDNAVSADLQMRKNGISNGINVARIKTQTANTRRYGDFMVACDSNQIVEYNIDAGMDYVDITVAGWWRTLV